MLRNSHLLLFRDLCCSAFSNQPKRPALHLNPYSTETIFIYPMP